MRFQVWFSAASETRHFNSYFRICWNNWKCVRNLWAATWKINGSPSHGSSSSLIQCCWRFWVKPLTLIPYRSLLLFNDENLSDIHRDTALTNPTGHKFMFDCSICLISWLSLSFKVHLLSLFDNVNRVVFHEKNYDQILSFQSQEGETVPLNEPIVAQVKA